MEMPLAESIELTKLSAKPAKRNDLYLVLRGLFCISTKVYFSRISVHNLQAVPKNVPLILVSNHPSAFMDPILLGSLMEQECIFLARGEAFKKKFGNIMMHKMNALPVYREDVSPDKIHLNRDTFRKSFQWLDKGKTLFFFPEGISQTEPRLRPLKKGLARLVFNYADENNWQQEVCLIPVGLSYTDPHSFRSKVAIHFGEPVMLDSWKNMYAENKAKTINSFTDFFRQQLENLTIFIPDVNQEPFARNIEKLSGFWEAEDTSIALNQLKTAVQKTQQIIGTTTEKQSLLEKETAQYFDKLDNLNVENQTLKNIEKRNLIYNVFILMLGFLIGLPIFIYGAVNHILPYLLAGFVTQKMSPRPDFTGSLRLASGTFLTVIFYLLQTTVVGVLTSSFPLAIIYLCSMPVSGYFSILFAEWILLNTQILKLHYIKLAAPEKFADLLNGKKMLEEKLL